MNRVFYLGPMFEKKMVQWKMLVYKHLSSVHFMIHTVPTEIQRWHKTVLHYSKFWPIKSKAKQLCNIQSMYVCNFLLRLTGEIQAIHRCQINLSFPRICLQSLKVALIFDVFMFMFCHVTKESRPAAASADFLSSCQISRT